MKFAPSILYQTLRYGLVTAGLFGVRWWLDQEVGTFATPVWRDTEYLLLTDCVFAVTLAAMILGGVERLLGRKSSDMPEDFPRADREPTLAADSASFLLEQTGLSIGVVQGQLFYRAGQPPDLKLHQANPYFHVMMDGVTQHGQSELESWLGISPDKMVLRSDESWLAWQPGAPFEFDAWIPVLGKTLQGHIIPRPEGKFWGIFVDVTDLRMQEQNVVQLSKLLNKYKDDSKLRTTSFLEETELFLFAIVHNLNEARDGFSDKISLAERMANRHALEKLTESIMHYAWTLRLTYNVQLTDMTELVRTLLLSDTLRHKAFRVSSTDLPQVMVAPQVVSIAFQNLLEALLDATPADKKIVLGTMADFLDTLFLMSVEEVNYDEVSDQLQNDLRFSLARQLLVRHGGRLDMHERVNGIHVEIVLGKPYPGLPLKES